ncbi:NADP-dependent oxidoreductase domain-containing protein [Catenaria anguillulae PL171]|uniref:NADP-dependent oxidoreductase domain-containing protein n=1 Tax=Catenaria anguillulae PL171 TaxID=765915 RepID=A0A1Y2HI08_9FUNG|nr:NADP-dependent oxidoreductase domain-containing protein [Catenaria anguillulae PL171]
MTIVPAIPTIRLRSGRHMPALAFGCGSKWRKSSTNPGESLGPTDDDTDVNRDLVDLIKYALGAGIRHLDSAEVYHTELEVGVAVCEFLAENPNVKREDIWITSKLHPGLVDVRGTLERAIRRMGVGYLDAYLIHSPFIDGIRHVLGPDLTHADFWASLHQAQLDGLVREIGVSSFDAPHIDLLFTKDPSLPMPAFNQIEYHPLLPQPLLHKHHAKFGIQMSSYSPLVPIVPHPKLGDLVDGTEAGKHFLHVLDTLAAKLGEGVTRAMVLLRWNLDMGHAVVSTSGRKERIDDIVAVGRLRPLNKDECDEVCQAAEKVGKVRRLWPAEKYQE